MSTVFALDELDRLAAQEAGEHELVDVLRQRRARGVRGDRVEPERDGDRDPAVGREVVGAAVLVDLPVHERRARGRSSASGTCRRCGVPLRGSCVITAGSVMNGAGSSGQQRWIGSRSRSTSSPVEHDLLHGAVANGRRRESAIDFSFCRPRTFSDEPLRRLHLEHVARACAATSSSGSTPNARHMRRSVPNWLISSGCCAPFALSKRSAGPPAFTVRSTISVTSRCGSTSAVTRTSSPSRSRRADPVAEVGRRTC